MVGVLHMTSGFFKILSGILLQSFHMGMSFEKDHKCLKGRNLNVHVRIPTGPNTTLDTDKDVLIPAASSPAHRPPHKMASESSPNQMQYKQAEELLFWLCHPGF